MPSQSNNPKKSNPNPSDPPKPTHADFKDGKGFQPVKTAEKKPGFTEIGAYKDIVCKDKDGNETKAQVRRLIRTDLANAIHEAVGEASWGGSTKSVSANTMSTIGLVGFLNCELPAKEAIRILRQIRADLKDCIDLFGTPALKLLRSRLREISEHPSKQVRLMAKAIDQLLDSEGIGKLPGPKPKPVDDEGFSA